MLKSRTVKCKVGILILVLLFMLCGCTKYKETGIVDAVVINKDFQDEYSIMVPIIVGNTTTMTTQFYSAEYHITLQYKNMEIIINDKKLFNKVKIKDKVKIRHYTSLDGSKEKIEYISN